MKPSLKKNYLYRVLYEILILITPFITTPYVSRVLGADGIGIYSYTHSIVSYFMLFGALGTMGYGTREIARNRDDKRKASKLFWEIELMTVATTGCCLIIWIVVIFTSKQYSYYYLALTPFLLSTMFDISWFFTGYEMIKSIVIRNSLVRIMGIILLFLLVKQKQDVMIYCIINSGVSLLGNLSMWMYIPRMIEKVNFRELQFKHHFQETLVYFIPTIATSIYTVLDKTLIGLITENEFQNGYYEQATKVINIIKSLVFVAVNSVMGARLSYLFAEEKYEEIHRRIDRSMNFIYLLGYGCAFGVVAVAQRFVPMFFGKGFEPVVPLLYVMAPLIIIIGTSNCLGTHYYTPSGQRKRSAKVIVLGAVINLCLNLLMIPRFGVYGAAIASVIAECVITIFYVQMSGGYMSWQYIGRVSIKRVISGSVMVFVVWIIGNHIILSDLKTVILQVIIGGIIYLGLLLFMKDTMLIELLGMGKHLITKIQKSTR